MNINKMQHKKTKTIQEVNKDNNISGNKVVQTIFDQKLVMKDSNNINDIPGFSVTITLDKPKYIRVNVNIGKWCRTSDGSVYNSAFYIKRNNELLISKADNNSSKECTFTGYDYGSTHYGNSFSFEVIDGPLDPGKYTYQIAVSPHGDHWLNRGREYDTDKYDRGTISTLTLEELPKQTVTSKYV